MIAVCIIGGLVVGFFAGSYWQARRHIKALHQVYAASLGIAAQLQHERDALAARVNTMPMA